MIDPRGEYQRRLEVWRERIAALDRVNYVLSNLRIAIALPGFVLLWMAIIRRSISPFWPICAGLAFAAVAVVHAVRLQRFGRAKAAERVYLRGLDRLDGRWTGTGRGGATFLEHHAYAGGLDLFGPASLFELLNTTRTEIGEQTLAGWLREPARLDDVRARQSAVAELRPMLDFKEDIAVLAAESAVGPTDALSTWAASAPVRFNPAVRVLFTACATVSIALAMLVARDVIGLDWFIGWVCLESLVAAFWRRAFHRIIHGIEMPERALGLLADLLGRIESARFTSPRLAELHHALLTGGAPPSARIARLRRLVSWADSTHNLLFAPIAYVLLLKPLLAIAVDRWHANYGGAVQAWLRVVGEVEALAALATYAYERPDDPFPDLSDTGPVYEAEGLGHPLILHGGVRNQVILRSAGPRVIIVSGSNMSGKSTLLRSVGVSVVLALAGAPVTATRLKLSALVLGATLHVEDSLQAGHSSFFAEILRIRAIAEAARGTTPLLFLLDEILHGTNSHDRRIGAEGIVRALTTLGAVGLVTTHDLALTELAATLDGAVNWHFEDRLVDGKMVFDYRMRPGVVAHSNALALMRAVGLEV